MNAPINLLYDSSIECIACSREFTIKKVRKTRLRLKNRDTDTCPHYEGDINPLFYDFFVCPICGTVFTRKHEAKYEKQKEKLKIFYRQMVNTNHLKGQRSVEDAIRLAKLSLMTSQILDSSVAIFASLCMKIAWFNRYNENKEEEIKFIEHSSRHYEKLYYSSDDTFPEENVLYMLGELNYKVNGYEKARGWFGKLISMEKKTPMVKKGQERWMDIKSEHEKEERKKAEI